MAALPDHMLSLRKARKLTQEDAAKGAGIAYRSYRRYEMGEREPAASTLVKLANFYGVTIDYLMGRADEK